MFYNLYFIQHCACKNALFYCVCFNKRSYYLRQFLNNFSNVFGLPLRKEKCISNVYDILIKYIIQI